MQIGGLRGAALSALLLAAASGCGSSSTGTGAITLHLTDAPGDFAEVNIDVREVQLASSAGWQTIASPNRVIDLMTLTNGVSETLASNFPIEAGHYTQMRLVLGPNNSVRPVGAAAAVPLTVPSGMQSGIKLNVNFDVEPGTTKDVFIDFDAHRSIFVHQAGASGKYILRPVVTCFAQVVTGTISGVVTDAASGQPVAGALVMAETVDGAGNASIVRSTTSDGTGKYALPLLPVGASYYLVTQPTAGATVYAAYASAAIPLTAAAPLATQDIKVTAAAQSATVSGKVTPVAANTSTTTTTDEVVALKAFGPVKLVVRDENAAVSGGVETYALASLPAGTYDLFVARTVHDAVTDTDLSKDGALVSVTVAAAPVTQDLTAPTVP